jgi:hypothetical protein
MLREGSVRVEAGWCGVQSDRDERCERVHRALKRIVKARGALDTQEAAALREAERLRIWRRYGYGSLLEYMEMEMGYTPRAALERLRVAKAIEALPVMAEKMEQGDLSFSAARELTRVATAETEDEWIDAASDKNLRQIEELVSGHAPGDKPADPIDPRLRTTRLRYDDIQHETKALLRQAREILEREHGERLTDDAFLRTFARMIIDGAAAPERPRAPHQIAITVCGECKRGWQHGGGAVVEMSPATLDAAQCDAVQIGAIGRDADRSAPARQSERVATESLGPVARTRSTIPPAVRRKVKHRDHGMCRVPWCRSSRNCDVHHIQPRSTGGPNTEQNLITLCESHHLAHHAGALLIEGTASKPIFQRRAHNAFASAERAVETAKALRALGFDRAEVKTAMEQTRTHVGTAELTLEQWIKIALGYCPKPKA